MLMEGAQSREGQRQPALDLEERNFVSLADIRLFLRRFLWFIASLAAAGLFVAWSYVSVTPPIYTAETQIMIEPKLPQYFQEQTGGIATSLDTAQVESQIVVLRSEKIATMVIDHLGLMNNPNFFQHDEPDPVDRLQALLSVPLRTFGLDGGSRGGAPAASRKPASGPVVKAPASDISGKAGGDGSTLSDFERSRMAIAMFQNNLKVVRVGVSYALSISFSSPDPELAAEIANAVAKSFVREQIETKAAAARQSGQWLESRLAELRTKMNAATQLSEELRSRHDYSVKRSDSKLINGQIVLDADNSSATSALSEPTLGELEVSADTYRKMYESVLLAYTNNISQQTYPVAGARVITAATRPLAPSYPRRKLIMAFGLIAGAMGGVVFAFLRHSLDPTIRSLKQIHEHFGLACLGELPRSGRRGRGFGLPDEAVTRPNSRFSHSLKRIKAAIRFSPGGRQPLKLIGVTSTSVNEDKSTVASNLALLYALGGARTLLIDADPDNARLSARLSRRRADQPSEERSAEIPGRHAVETLLIPGSADTLKLMPAAASAGLMTREEWEALAADLGAHSVMVVDLPPLSSGIERLAITSLLDGVILVAEWGATRIDAMDELVSALQASKAPLLGVVMTKVRYMTRKPFALIR